MNLFIIVLSIGWRITRCGVRQLHQVCFRLRWVCTKEDTLLCRYSLCSTCVAYFKNSSARFIFVRAWGVIGTIEMGSIDVGIGWRFIWGYDATIYSGGSGAAIGYTLLSIVWVIEMVMVMEMVAVVWWFWHNCFAPTGDDNIIAETVTAVVVVTVMKVAVVVMVMVAVIYYSASVVGTGDWS